MSRPRGARGFTHHNPCYRRLARAQSPPSAAAHIIIQHDGVAGQTKMTTLRMPVGFDPSSAQLLPYDVATPPLPITSYYTPYYYNTAPLL